MFCFILNHARTLLAAELSMFLVELLPWLEQLLLGLDWEDL